MTTTFNSLAPAVAHVRFLDKSELPQVLNCSYIAERFFRKSPSWLSQKLNGTIVNGKPATFTHDELRGLRDALRTLQFEIASVADDLTADLCAVRKEQKEEELAD